MQPDFGDIHDGLHKYLADEIHHATDPHADEHQESGWDKAMHLATDFAGHLAMDMFSEFVSLNLLAGHVPPRIPAHGNHHDHGLHTHSGGHGDLFGHGHGAVHSVGTPTDGGFTEQTTGFTCALVSQKMILDQFGVIDHQTGKPISEAMLVFEATNHGWLTEHGTSLNDMANLLELHDIPCHHGHDWHHLVKDLAEGHHVAIAVNSRELWHGSGLSTVLNEILPGHPDHAVVLKGLKVDDHGHVSVVINDPGQPDGAGVEYSLKKFQAALGNGEFHFVATDEAPPGWQHDAHLQHSLASHAPNGTGTHALAESHVPESYADHIDGMTEDARVEFLRLL